jgi:hypothetical protein
MAPGMCGDGAAEAKCDGPEDCSGAQPNCCVNVSFSAASDMGAGSPTGGGAMCITDCPPSVDLQTRMGQSKLCRTEADCVGYEGFLAFDGCCSSPQVPGVKFCAPKSATFMNLGGYTCN